MKLDTWRLEKAVYKTITSIIDENKGFERKNIEVKTAKNRNTSRKNVELQKYWITKMSNYKNIEKENS